jgi:release factor glutamine methyltransferase
MPAISSLPGTVSEALARGKRDLVASAIAEPGLEAAILLGHALGGRTRAWLLSHGEATLDRCTASCFVALIARRCLHEPSAYLVGEKHWLDMVVAVNRNVLIPRPETELLALDAITIARGLLTSGGARQIITDIGTGSGAIALALARALPEATILAADSSPGALRIARANADRLDVGNVTLIEGSLLASLPDQINLLVANMPYVPTSDLPALDLEISYEPRSALDGGNDGLDIIRALLKDARTRIARGGWLLLEHGMDQANRLVRETRNVWPDAIVQSRQDLSGRDRFLHVEVW